MSKTYVNSSRFNVIPDRHTSKEVEDLSPIVGVQVFDTTNQNLKFWNGSVWENAGSGSVAVGQRAANYDSLADGTVIGELAYCNLPQGTQWLPKTIGGNYYPAGWYLWDGSIWTSDRNNIVNQLQLNVNGLGNKSDVGHTHLKSEITDFNDGDYATQSQGVLADLALQPDDNISTLTNDSGYLTEGLQSGDNISELTNDSLFVSVADLGEKGLSAYYQEFTYTNGALTKIEYYNSVAKTALYYTKDFTYTNGSLTQLVLTNNNSNDTETKNFSYDVDGNLTNITKS